MRRNHHEDEIERNLKALDGIKDTRSKEEIYRNIQLKLKEPKQSVRRFRKPVVWGLSTAAVVVLTVIVVSQGPSPSSQGEFGAESTAEREEERSSMDEGDVDEDTEEDQEEIVIEEDEEEIQEETREEDAQPPADSNGEEDEQEEDVEEEDSIDRRVVEMDEVYADVHYRPAASQNEQQLLALPFLAPDNETIVPITVDHSGDAEENGADEMLDRIDPDALGLQASPLLDIEEQEQEDVKIREGLEEIARFDIEQPWPSEWEEWFQQEDAGSEASAGYYVFQADEGNAYLVTGQSLDMEGASDENLEETLQRMETEENEYVDSVIPPYVELDDVDERGDESVLLSYSGLDEWSENDETQLLIFVEGVLLTAADFGYHDVEFDGAMDEIEQVGPYDLSETIDPPVSPNYIEEIAN
ncbi:hypothetical protein HUG15_06015 [Salicibibacter cibarius]|uniref:Uncharacterized protein n=1 Tax=Salicibibacter cibarius TaxID=2743000 RepID=A0A7T6Z1Z6_9BACI|nr:hypothetical protein [Salicibibacter cibarius]QQK75207.1 hypothetical protein HUG15_06015 [Salicibibacter cibarius]